MAADTRERTLVELTRAPIDRLRLEERVADPGAGALVVFLGVVRDHHEGRRVLHLEYEAYEAMARAEMERIAARLLEEHPAVLRLALVHRFGDLAIGEASVGVAVSTAHRREAFSACSRGIDAVKATVPIWKREHYAEGEPRWVRAECMHGPDA